MFWKHFGSKLGLGYVGQAAKARFSTSASREAPVDNECLGKSRQVGGSGELGIQAKLLATGLDT